MKFSINVSVFRKKRSLWFKIGCAIAIATPAMLAILGIASRFLK